MTRLLISVRDADEAATALAGGADLVDIKEPSHGSLGAASAGVWQAVLGVCGGRVPLSVALGELHEAELRLSDDSLAEFQFAKIGLAGWGRREDWRDRWAQSLDRLPQTVVPVAVIYADGPLCDAPTPREIVCLAADLGCGAILFDTYLKSGSNLFTHLGSRDLGDLIAEIRQRGMQVVLGGSLAGPSIIQACGLNPDYIAVRGAACRGSRTGTLDPSKVRELSQTISH
jgi:uncharacterized protein (UPF0264 family)